jgi:diguanylate cyclase (GGDEF)-like protein
MALRPRFTPGDFPDSPYAKELTRGIRELHFNREIEDEYRPVHLGRVRMRIRIWCLISIGIAIGFAIQEDSRQSLFTMGSLLRAACIASLWAILAAVAISPHYERWYLPVAQVLVTLVSALIAWFIAFAVASGQQEELLLLAIQLFAIFFFMGLLIRAAVAAALVLVVSFALGAWASGIPAIHAIPSTVFLCIAAAVAAHICRDKERAYRTSFLEQTLIAELLERDALTGLKNRRAFDEHLRRIWQQAQRDHRVIAVLMLDVDHFKRYNDAHGHQAGDEALRRVARVISEFARRPLDIAARYGGEEFSIVLFDLAPEFVIEIAERVRRSIEDECITHGDSGVSPYVTSSVGVAIVEPAIGRTVQGAVQLADEALYEAKATGRNSIVVRDKAQYGSMRTGQFEIIRRI